MLTRVLENQKKRKELKHDENQYLNLIEDIINFGSLVKGRNGNVVTVIGTPMHFNLENNIFPILTTKKVAWRTCAKELFWFKFFRFLST